MPTPSYRVTIRKQAIDRVSMYRTVVGFAGSGNPQWWGHSRTTAPRRHCPAAALSGSSRTALPAAGGGPLLGGVPTLRRPPQPERERHEGTAAEHVGQHGEPWLRQPQHARLEGEDLGTLGDRERHSQNDSDKSLPGDQPRGEQQAALLSRGRIVVVTPCPRCDKRNDA